LKKDRESLSRLSSGEFKLATYKTLGCDMPRVSLKMMCTAFGHTPLHTSPLLSLLLFFGQLALRDYEANSIIPHRRHRRSASSPRFYRAYYRAAHKPIST